MKQGRKIHSTLADFSAGSDVCSKASRQADAAGTAMARKRCRRLRLKTLSWLAFAGLLGPVSYVQGDTTGESLLLDIPAQAADEAVKQLARTFKRSVIFQTDDVATVRTNPLEGRYTIQEALAAMFDETSLEGSLTKNGVIFVSRAEQAGDRQVQESEVNNGNHGVKRTLFGAIAAFVLGTSGAAAQDAADNDDEIRTIDEIVVTAQKREQSLQEVPISVQALSNGMMQDRGIRDLSEIITFVPGASEELSNSIGQRRYQIRGVAQGPGDSTVGYYFDDAAFPAIGALAFAPPGRAFDMNRVEVLRGPQGTLYGNGAMGGVVRFIPNAPDMESFDGRFAGGYSTVDDGDDSYYLDAAASIPLIEDKLAVRGVVSYEDVGGYAETFGGDENVDGGDILNYRALLQWDATDRFTAKLLYMGNEVEQGASTLFLSLDPPVTSGGPNDYTISDYDIINGTLIYEFDFATLTSSTSYIENSVSVGLLLPFPVGGNIVDLFIDATIAGETVNNETRLVSNGGGPLQWVAGVYYYDTDIDTRNQTTPTGVFPDTLGFLESESVSLFGEISYELFDGKLVPLVGLRYFEDTRATGTRIIDGPVIRERQEADFDNVSPRFNLSWYPTDTSLFFLNIAEGFRSGGFNSPVFCPLNPACEEAVDPDTLWSYELGTKLTWLDERVILDAAVYLQEWEDYRANQPAGPTSVEVQIGDAEMVGIDLSFMYLPEGIDGFSLQLAANWNDSEITSLNPLVEGNTTITVGQQLPFVPDWTASLAANYEHEFGNGILGKFNLTYSHVAEQFGGIGQTGVGDARDLLGTRIGIETARTGIFLVGRNLLNEDGAIWINQQTPGGPLIATRDRPRTVGLELTMDF